jgi:hypothetical protein
MTRICCAIACYGFILLLPLAVGAAPSPQSDTCTGWKVEKMTTKDAQFETCIATFINKQPAELSIIAEGPLLTLTISSPSFGGAKREEAIGLSQKGLGNLQRSALFKDGTYGITIDNDVDSYLEQDAPLVFTIRGVDYSFTISNAASAIDAVRRCVGEPTKAEMQVNKSQSFAVPAGWEALRNAGGCAAVLKGDEVDTWLTVNNNDQVLLIVGRHDWNFWGERIKLTLQIDSQAPRSFDASKWNNLVLLLLPDENDVTALRKASSLKWHLPNGDYSAKVHHVGAALDAAAECTRNQRTGTSR